MEEKSYEIGGKKYTQRRLVYGQWRRLLKIIPEIVGASGDKLALTIALSDKIPDTLATVLTPEGMHPKDVDVKALAAEIEWSLSDESIVSQVLTDFFVYNPLSSIMENLSTSMAGLKSQMENGLTGSSAILQPEISQSESGSSGTPE